MLPLTGEGAACAAAPQAAQSRATLGLENLPARIAALADGMVYGIACEQQAVRLPFVASALAGSLQLGRHCALVTASDPGMFLRKAQLAGFALHPHLRSGLLTIFQVMPDTGKQIFKVGPEGFLRELEQGFPRRDAFLVLDRAESVFMLSDPRASTEAAHTYLQWILERNHTLLALFAPAASAPRDYLTLRLIAENFAGFAIVRSAEGGAMLEVRHWFGAQAASPQESFRLRNRPSGPLLVRPAQDGEELPPVDGVIFAQGAIDDAGPALRGWQKTSSIVDAVDAARGSEAATLLLPFEGPQSYEVLCRAVVTVRAMGRPALRVVVREHGMRLRASQALALMRLGVSSIVPAGVSDAIARRMVDSLRGTRFTRPYDMDAQQVDEETRGLLGRAVTSAGSFCDVIERLLAAADDFDIESGLVRLDFAGEDPWRVVKVARRLGRDIVAFAQGCSAWLFIFGCPAVLTLATLQRLLGAPVDEVCNACSSEHDPEKILLLLGELRERHSAPTALPRR